VIHVIHNVMPILLQSTVEDWANTGTTGFQGKIDHHGAGKPFKDGFVNKMPATAAAQQSSEQQGEKVSWTQIKGSSHGVGACMDASCRSPDAVYTFIYHDRFVCDA
jgi:hypothetical protein